jgi:hypothetical protein
MSTSTVGYVYRGLRHIVVFKMLMMYDLRLRVSYSTDSFDHMDLIVLTSAFPTKIPPGVSSIVPPSMYLRP